MKKPIRMRKELDTFFEESISFRSYRYWCHLALKFSNSRAKDRNLWMDGAKSYFEEALNLRNEKYPGYTVFLRFFLHDSFSTTKKPTATWAWIRRYLHRSSGPEIGLQSKHQTLMKKFVTEGIDLGVFRFNNISVPAYLTEYYRQEEKRYTRVVWFFSKYSKRNIGSK